MTGYIVHEANRVRIDEMHRHASTMRRVRRAASSSRPRIRSFRRRGMHGSRVAVV